MANENTGQEAVASEPKLFIGQLPMDCSEVGLQEVLQSYAKPGEQVSVIFPRKSNTPQTCRFAMVTFAKWASAEAAVEALHGSTAFGNKPLVVRIADPPKGEDSKGIVPKKLFVGQIPKECGESQVRAWFQPYGSIVSLVVKHNALAANIAFVLFSSWGAAEEAVGALHGTKPVASAANPLVVKFADGKGRGNDAMGVGIKRGNDADTAGLSKRANLGMGQMAGNAGMRGMGMGMQGGMMTGGYGNPHGYAMMGMGGMQGGVMGGRMGMWGQDSRGSADGMQGGMQGGEMSQMGGMHGGMGMGGAMPRMGGGMNPDMAMNMGSMHGGVMGGMQGMGQGGMQGMGSMGTPGMGVGMGGMQMNGMYQEEMGMQRGFQGGFGAMALGGENDPSAAHMHGGGGAASADARKCPWKLFVGQLPFTAGEEALMQLFGNFGDILDCKVLRKPGSQESKGCGFVTFAASEHAAHAMRALNQQAAIPGHARKLIVHYAK